ncbi:hypothetical protein SSX86_012220 [Deinandra increscens subsp. villosa]|uniref:Late embryogenesis abundant protein LEA-2 subgroup domain-containing protein n=1 Tax=Deinandra increscens subsp. villosa TaxID=3103831 RepID=A0AAP0DBC8_9ASTR
MADQSRPVTGYPAFSAAAAAHHPNGYPNTATAYPYPAPPPPNNQASYFHVAGNPYYSNPYASQQRATFVHRFFAFLIGSILITGIIVFIMWLVLRPQIPQFRVETLTLSNFNVSTNSLISGNWDARFVARNPNSKITLYYDQIEAAIFYKSDSISETTLPPFVQGKKNETTIRATFASLTAYLDGRDSINGERDHGKVNFNLRMMTRVRFQAGSWWARRRILRVYCPNLTIGVSANSGNGTLVGGSKQCNVGAQLCHYSELVGPSVEFEIVFLWGTGPTSPEAVEVPSVDVRMYPLDSQRNSLMSAGEKAREASNAAERGLLLR